MTADALTVCNCCDVEPMAAGNRAGYCTDCERAAREGGPCWHDPEADS